jgi:hypothetical protein
MKKAHFLFMVISLGALTSSLSAAGEPPRLPSEQEGRDPHATIIHPSERAPGGGNHVERPHSLLKGTGHMPEKSSQPGPLHIPPKSNQSTEFHAPALRQTAAAAHQGLIKNKVENHVEPPAKPPLGSGNAPARAQVVHVRSAAPGTLGGPMASTAKTSTAVLDGAAFKRKTW